MTPCLPLWRVVLDLRKHNLSVCREKPRCINIRAWRGLKLDFRLNYAISLCRKSGAGGLPANYPEPGHEGILTGIIIFMALLSVISKFLKQWKRKCCSNISFEHSQTKQSQHIRSWPPSRLWRKLATQFWSVKPLEARSRQSRGSRTRCPSTWRPTRGSAWWSKVNYEVRRRWKNLEDFTDRVRISFTFFLSRYFQCSCLV